jgi:hypothetical protein
MAKKGKAAKADNENTKKRSNRTIIWLIIVSVFMVAFLRTGFIFFILAILPSVVAFYIDRSYTRSTFHTVFACNLSGALPFLARILKNGAAQAEIQVVMSDPLNWMIIYASAGFGWLLVYAAPTFAQGFINMLHQNQIRRLDRMQRRIINEWGKEVDSYNATQDEQNQ